MFSEIEFPFINHFINLSKVNHMPLPFQYCIFHIGNQIYLELYFMFLIFMITIWILTSYTWYFNVSPCIDSNRSYTSSLPDIALLPFVSSLPLIHLTIDLPIDNKNIQASNTQPVQPVISQPFLIPCDIQNTNTCTIQTKSKISSLKPRAFNQTM